MWYQTSTGDKIGVRATVTPDAVRHTSSPAEAAELQISVDFSHTHSHDWYVIHWVETARDRMVGWHQNETHMDLGECHFQIAYQGETGQRAPAEFLDVHPLNVFDQRLADLVGVLDALLLEDDAPTFPAEALR